MKNTVKPSSLRIGNLIIMSSVRAYHPIPKCRKVKLEVKRV